MFPAPAAESVKGPGISGGGIASAGAILGAIASLIASVVIAIITSAEQVPLDPWFILVAELPLWAGFLGAAALASKKHGSGRLTEDYGLGPPTVSDVRLGTLGGLLGRVIPTLYLLLVVLLGHEDGSSSTRSSTVLGLSPSGVAGWFVVVVLVVIGAPIVEEIFFRGLIQGVFSRRTGPVPALFITAVIFSFAHVPGEGPFAPLLLFPGAVVLGYLKLRTGRLAAGIVAHAEFNAIGIVLVLVPGLH